MKSMRGKKRVEEIETLKREIREISKDEVGTALKRMKNGKMTCERHYGLMKRKNTTDAMLAGETLMKKQREGQLLCVFVVREKAYDRLLREELWFCMRESGQADKLRSRI